MPSEPTAHNDYPIEHPSLTPGAYADGGVIDEPVLGIGLRSGSRYALGERGPERVTPTRAGATAAIEVPVKVSVDATALDALKADVAELLAQLHAYGEAHGGFAERLTSRKFLLAVAAQIPLLVGWISGHLAGQTAATLIVVLNVVYILVEGALDAKATP